MAPPGGIGAAESLSSIFGPILMTQVFGAFEHMLPGAPFFVAAALSVAALFIATRAAPPPFSGGSDAGASR